MTITVTSTDKIITLKADRNSEPIPARIWEGETESGIKVHCFITRLAADKDANQNEFQKELQSHEAPSPEVAAYPMRMII